MAPKIILVQVKQSLNTLNLTPKIITVSLQYIRISAEKKKKMKGQQHSKGETGKVTLKRSKSPSKSRKSRQSNRSNKSNTIRTKPEVDGIKETEEKQDILDRTCTSVAEDICGTRANSLIILAPECIAKMEEVYDLGPFPSGLLKELRNSGINTPHMLVNAFGRGIAALAKEIVFTRVFILIEKHPDITRRLFTLSRLILALDLTLTHIFPQQWIKTKKKKYI